MRIVETVAAASPRSWARCVLITTLLVGLSDFLQSYLLFTAFRHRPIIGVFQGPATGLFGRAAMQGGLRTAAIGTALHFFIAFAWTVAGVLAYRASPRIRLLASSMPGLLALAMVAGCVVWLTMDWAVLRFSKAHYYALSETYFWMLLVGHIPFVGLPLVWGVSRLGGSRSPRAR
jgi:hypothetical protein